MGLSHHDQFQLLLLDLDCVTIYGGNPRDGLDKEIRLLHPDLAEEFSSLDKPVVLLTHRSHKDASYIREKLEQRGVKISDLVSARELFLSALRQFQFKNLLVRGLSKSYALDWLERKYNLDRRQMVLIDDRRENLLELTRSGMKSALLAPFSDGSSTSSDEPFLDTFRFQEVAEHLDNLIEDQPEILELKAERRALSSLPVIGEIEGDQISLFERFRQAVKAVRDLRRKRLSNN